MTLANVVSLIGLVVVVIGMVVGAVWAVASIKGSVVAIKGSTVGLGRSIDTMKTDVQSSLDRLDETTCKLGDELTDHNTRIGRLEGQQAGCLAVKHKEKLLDEA